MSQLKAVFFDVKGTLFDEHACARRVMDIVLPAFQEHFPPADHDDILRRYDMALLGMVRGPHLRRERPFSREVRFQGLLDSFGIKRPGLAQEMATRYDAARRLMMREFMRPGARDVIGHLSNRGLQTGLVMNGSTALQRALLQNLGLDEKVTHVVLAEAEGYSKPDTRLFNRLLELAGVPADRVLYVGDSPLTDVLGAQRAGIPVVWYRTGRRRLMPGQAAPDFTISDLRELLPITRL